MFDSAPVPNRASGPKNGYTEDKVMPGRFRSRGLRSLAVIVSACAPSAHVCLGGRRQTGPRMGSPAGSVQASEVPGM